MLKKWDFQADFLNIRKQTNTCSPKSVKLVPYQTLKVVQFGTNFSCLSYFVLAP